MSYHFKDASVSGVKGEGEGERFYRTGCVNIKPKDLGYDLKGDPTKPVYCWINYIQTN